MASLFFILLCFSSMHANCEARHFGLKGFLSGFSHPNKGQFLVVEKLRLGMDSSSTKGSAFDEPKAPNDVETALSSPTTTSKGIMEHVGSAVFESSSSSTHLDLHEDHKAMTTTNYNKEPRRRGLYAKGRQTSYKANEEEEDDDDGVMLQDYKPPHQKPPIHNMKRT